MIISYDPSFRATHFTIIGFTLSAVWVSCRLCGPGPPWVRGRTQYKRTGGH